MNQCWTWSVVFLVLSIMILSAPASAQSQWNADGANIVNSNTGNVGVGAVGTFAKFQVDDTSTDVSWRAVQYTRSTHSIGSTGTNYLLGIETNVSDMRIPAGVTDSGYRMGARFDSYASTPHFAGNLYQQFGMTARTGLYNATSGASVSKSHAGYFEVLNNVPGTIIYSSYAVFANSNNGGLGSIVDAYDFYGANPTGKNYFAGNVGIGTSTPEAKLDINGVLQVKNPHSHVKLAGASSNGALMVSGHNLVVGNWDNPQKSISVNLTSGNVGIGTTNPQAKLHVDGNIVATTMSMTYQDVAEWVPSSKHISAGTVVIVDAETDNQVLPSSAAYDTRVAGVVSDSPGVLLGVAGEGKVKVATTGRVKVKVDASKGPINKGDLLVTSDKEGIAMRSEPIEFAGRRIHQPGTLIGKALQSLEEGEGEILVLLSLQ